MVYANLTNRGEPNNAPQPEEYEALPQYEILSDSNNERFNIYHIQRNGQTIRIRLTVARITRITNRFDNEGMPFFVLNSGPIIMADPPPSHRDNRSRARLEMRTMCKFMGEYAYRSHEQLCQACLV